MIIGRTLSIFLIIFILGSYNISYAQKKDAKEGDSKNIPSAKWRKKVVRKVYLYPVPGDDNEQKWESDRDQWAKFFTKLTTDGSKGLVKVYTGPDFATSVLPVNLKAMLVAGDDAEVTNDADNEKEKSVKNEINFEQVSQIRLFEEWVYYPDSGKTVIKITAIAPAREIMDDNGFPKSAKSLYWLKWDDFQKFAAGYNGFEALAHSGNVIWDDYFRDKAIMTDSLTSAPGKNKDKEVILTCTAARKTHISTDSAIGYDPNLIDKYDSSLTEILCRNVLAGTLKVYEELNYSPDGVLSKTEFKKIIASRDDTVVADDPVTGDAPNNIVHHEYCYECISNYCLAEQWRFNLNRGITEITYSSIAPMWDSRNDYGEVMTAYPLFWFNYEDARKLLTRYSEYNSNRTVEQQVWLDRFKEKKHERIKN